MFLSLRVQCPRLNAARDFSLMAEESGARFFKEREVSRSGVSMLVTVVVVGLHGCGSSADIVGGPETPEIAVSNNAARDPDRPTDSSGSFVRSASQTELQAPVSALKIANVPSKTFSRDYRTGALNVSFADLNLKAELDTQAVTKDNIKRFPDWLKSLEGTRIRIRGYMLPTFEEKGIDQFILDHSAREMNFGADPKVYELLEVHLAAGSTTNYVGGSRSTEVVGVFRINSDIQDGTIQALYVLEDAVVVNR